MMIGLNRIDRTSDVDNQNPVWYTIRGSPIGGNLTRKVHLGPEARDQIQFMTKA
ncbi:hypothetical protein LINPERHAP1_LOCUS21122 [Linum perenne]